ncbi:MAG: glycosyltransferase family 2 protein [Armatimonas sp.]
MLNIVIPMAGRGSRFADEGYTLPKPLIPVHGIEMIRLVIGNLRPSQAHRFIFLCLQEHIEKYQVDQKLAEWAPGCIVVPVKAVTEGAACTVLLAREYIDNDDPMMIGNSDQWVDVSIDDYLAAMGDADGLIMTMWADHPKWSYVRLDDGESIIEVVEKEVVSNEATVGIYNFRHGREFVAAADAMIARNFRVNGEFYVAPAYNEMIAEGKTLLFHNIGKEYEGMYGIGIPTDLKKFEGFPVSQKAVAQAKNEGDV